MAVPALHTLNELAPALEPLCGAKSSDELRAAIDRIAALRLRHVQLSATQPGLRPRELDRSARRDLISILRRKELQIAGLDAWIPPEHFVNAATSDRAVTALLQAIELASDFGRVPVSVIFPTEESGGPDVRLLIETITAHAERFGVQIADHALQAKARNEWLGIGIDPAVWLIQAKDPVAAVATSKPMSARLCDVLSTGMRGPIGNRKAGKLDLMSYKVGLSVAGYTRPLIIDARQWEDPWEGLQQSKTAWDALP